MSGNPKIPVPPLTLLQTFKRSAGPGSSRKFNASQGNVRDRRRGIAKGFILAQSAGQCSVGSQAVEKKQPNIVEPTQLNRNPLKQTGEATRGPPQNWAPVQVDGVLSTSPSSKAIHKGLPGVAESPARGFSKQGPPQHGLASSGFPLTTNV